MTDHLRCDIVAAKRRQERKLKEELSRMRATTQEKMINQLITQQQSKVTLNVGGKLYDTSVSTLVRIPESMFAAMFSGRYNLKAENVRALIASLLFFSSSALKSMRSLFSLVLTIRVGWYLLYRSRWNSFPVHSQLPEVWR
jgi:hypothetical protein